MPPRSSANNHFEDEISLRDLLTVLRHSKGLILSIVAMMTILAMAYAFLSAPTYRTQALVRAPHINELVHYSHINAIFNVAQAADHRLLREPASDAGPGSVNPNPNDVYQIFLQQLQALGIRREFFENAYLSDYSNIMTNAEKSYLWNQFNQGLSVPVATESQDIFSIEKITLQGETPTKIADWLNQYIAAVIHTSREQLGKTLEDRRQAYLRDIDIQIDSLRTIAAVKRKNEIFQLNEALKLAKAAHINKPLSAGNLVASYEGPTLFLRGSEILSTEIDLLKARASDDAYISELPVLLHTRNLLENLDIDPERLTVAVIDQAAAPPTTPIRPRKKLIVTAGLILGLILGALTALMRYKLSTDRQEGQP